MGLTIQKIVPSLFLNIETKVIKRGYLRTTHNTDTTLMTTTKAIAVVNNTTTSYSIQLTAQQTTYVFITLAVITVGIALLIVTYNSQQLNDYINIPTFENQEQLDYYVIGPNHKEVNSQFGNK
ncbi:1101_t:CDS:2 [Gigaspora margarita]|uniref:1101_t:CDS:1 n=1 Tax=Gigaspora margarita TaxID=4874 RepID=A0ABN7WAP1_GIGMA|nr:1101_t:CDS:2 [Gigaspora margarita]